MKCIVIARVSTEEQKKANNSLPAQITRLQEYCKRKEFDVIKEFSFDESAYKSDREDFDKILDFVIEQKEKVAVCFDKVDRLSRNIFDKRVSILYEKALKDDLELHFVSDGQIVNSRLSAVEKFNFSISLGLAKYYSDAISDNVKRAQENMLRMGIYPTKPPYGYKRVSIEEGVKDNTRKIKTKIVVDEYSSRIVMKAFELYSTGTFSMNSLREKIKSDYGLNWSKGFIDSVLNNQFYCGVMTWQKKQYNHSYIPIISKTLFDKVQDVKSSFNKKPFKFAGKPYMYRGLLRCGHCGMSITPEKHKGHVYYHCTQYNGKHDAKWLREESITEQIGNVFKRIQLPSEVLQKIVVTLKQTHESKVSFREEQFKEINLEREKYSKRLEKIYLDKLDGSITNDEYDNFRQSFRNKISEIDTRLSILQDTDDNYYITANYILELTKRAHELFLSSEMQEKRQLVRLVLSNLRIEDEKVQYDLIKPFDEILNCSDSQLWLRVKGSNLQPWS